jgi:hypothetical protein
VVIETMFVFQVSNVFPGVVTSDTSPSKTNKVHAALHKNGFFSLCLLMYKLSTQAQAFFPSVNKKSLDLPLDNRNVYY